MAAVASDASRVARRDKVAAVAAPSVRPPRYGPLLTPAEHKAHIEAHYMECCAEHPGQIDAMALHAHCKAHGLKVTAGLVSTEVIASSSGRVIKTSLDELSADTEEWERPWNLAKLQVRTTVRRVVPGRPPEDLEPWREFSSRHLVDPWVLDEPPLQTTQRALIPGVEAALRTMRRGERARVTVRPATTGGDHGVAGPVAAAAPPVPVAASGDRGVAVDEKPPQPPQDDVVGYPAGHPLHGVELEVEVQLLDFQNPTSVMLMSPADELANATAAKALGNARLQAGQVLALPRTLRSHLWRTMRRAGAAAVSCSRHTTILK